MIQDKMKKAFSFYEMRKETGIAPSKLNRLVSEGKLLPASTGERTGVRRYFVWEDVVFVKRYWALYCAGFRHEEAWKLARQGNIVQRLRDIATEIETRGGFGKC